jgi:hypothetical protein
MSQEILSLGKAVIELGFSASAILIILGLVVWHQYRLAPIMTALVYSSQRLIESADKLAVDLSKHDDTVNGVVATAMQHAKDTHITCLDHGVKMGSILGELSNLKMEIAILKERIPT